jgi:hypothetical protein
MSKPYPSNQNAAQPRQQHTKFLKHDKPLLPGSKPKSAIERKMEKMKQEKDADYIKQVVLENSNLTSYIESGHSAVTDARSLFEQIHALSNNPGVMSAIDKLDDLVEKSVEGASDVKVKLIMAIRGFENDQNAAVDLIKDIEQQINALAGLMNDSSIENDAEKLRVSSNLDAITMAMRWHMGSQLGITAANLMTSLDEAVKYVSSHAASEPTVLQ